MANSDTRSAWHQIQDGVRDTERLITQNDYNLAMIKARQTLEVIIKQLSGQAGESDQNLADLIDSLYTDNIISKTSCEHYHKIRAIGNKAVHENNDDAYNANVSYSLLSEEVQTFIREYSPRKKTSAAVAAVKPERSERAERNGERSVRSGRSTRTRVRTGRRTAHSKKKPTINTPDLIKVIIGFVILIILILLFRAVNPLKGGKNKITTAPSVSAESNDTTESASEEVPETTAAVVYVTTARLNVRSAPSRDGDVLTVLGAGDKVEYAGEYDSTWSIINYNGGQAYVATAYIKPAP